FARGPREAAECGGTELGCPRIGTGRGALVTVGPAVVAKRDGVTAGGVRLVTTRQAVSALRPGTVAQGCRAVAGSLRAGTNRGRLLRGGRRHVHDVAVFVLHRPAELVVGDPISAHRGAGVADRLGTRTQRGAVLTGGGSIEADCCRLPADGERTAAERRGTFARRPAGRTGRRAVVALGVGIRTR